MDNQDRIIELGKAPDIILVRAKISLKARRISIRMGLKEVELIIPKRANFNVAHNFLLEKELWIRNKLRKNKPIPIHTENGLPKVISILGEDHEVLVNDQNIIEPIKIFNNQLLISHTVTHLNVKWIIISRLKKIMKKEVEIYADFIAKKLDITFNNISLRDTSSRWGSCSRQGNISLSWRLVLAPRHVMEYVIIHELCHLIEMNHSPRFWKLVNDICPEYTVSKLWLTNNGRKLHNLL
jgi:predicted metal-dependent hydrolase